MLSDYLDGELPRDLDHEVGEHLLTCESCLQVVQEYRRLGREIRQMPRQPVPATVEARIRDRIATRRKSPGAAFLESLRARPLVPALGTLAATLLIAFGLVFRQIWMAEPEFVAAYPQIGATDVAPDQNRPIEVVFDRPVDASTSDWVVMIDPPANVQAEVVGNKVVLRPIEPLQPGTTYTIVVEQKKATSGVASIAPRQPPVTLNFSTGTEVASAAPTSSPTPRRTPTTAPTAAATPTSPVVVAALPNTPTPTASRPTAVVVTPSPVVKVSPTVTVPLEVCVSDVSPSIARLLSGYPEAEHRLVCAVKPAATTTVTQQTFAEGIFISLGRDEAYVLVSGPNPGDRTWTSYGSKARTRTPEPTAIPPTGTPAPTASPTAGTPTVRSGASAATTPTVVSTPAPTLTPTAETPTPADTSTSAITPTPTDTPKPTGTSTATVTATPVPLPVGKEVRRVLGDPADIEEALGDPTSAEVRQAATVQELAGGTVISFRGEEGYVLLADGHWDRVVAAPTTPEPTASPSPPSPRRPVSTLTATPTPARLTPTPTPVR